MSRALFLVVWSLFSFDAIAQPQYRVITEDFRPFAYPTENGEVDGMSYEIVDWLLDDLDIGTEVEVLPWSRGIGLTKTKENHVLFSVARTKEREDWFKWVGPFYSDEVALYQLNDPKYPYKKDIKNEGSILVAKGYPEEKILRDEGYKNIILADNTAIAIQMLLKHRGDYFPIGQAALPCLLAKYNLEEDSLRSTDITLLTSHLYIAMSPTTSDEEVERWQKALDKIKQTSRYQDIVDNHSHHCGNE
ncbi:transporter substrate-binding domain-containing protein [Vibrio sp. 10N.261.55.A7]|uniref:substrate-binding periplasmic protein n=1 Tax=Vibrio sp. 10N.261.55.A7 TaxID=1880851 RepID=UPI000C85C761|nr:transporter substrate-binding domain-containing protein [Vibrio sp. 10N.261.55.A7]